jgi:hypothetical protein
LLKLHAGSESQKDKLLNDLWEPSFLPTDP